MKHIRLKMQSCKA